MACHRHHGREDDGYYGDACEGEQRVYAPRPPYVGESYQHAYAHDACEGEQRVYAPRPPYVGESYQQAYAHDGHILPSHRQHHQNANFQRNERLGELGAVAAGAFALYEGYKASNDKEHASKHMQEAGIAGLAALGSGGYALYEHRQKEKYSGGC